jgi:hypothetical protein
MRAIPHKCSREWPIAFKSLTECGPVTTNGGHRRPYKESAECNYTGWSIITRVSAVVPEADIRLSRIAGRIDRLTRISPSAAHRPLVLLPRVTVLMVVMGRFQHGTKSPEIPSFEPPIHHPSLALWLASAGGSHQRFRRPCLHSRDRLSISAGLRGRRGILALPAAGRRRHS